MKLNTIQTEVAEKTKSRDLYQKLKTGENGLQDSEAGQRLEYFGPNSLEEKKQSPLRKFLGYFWGPIPWMIEVAAGLSLVIRDWTDFIIIMVMLLFNAVIGFWQEYQADNALSALKEELASQARVKRDGQWQEIDARDLVPGDIIGLKIGDIIPGDVKLVKGDYLSVDESALTGESLPVDKQREDIAYSGSSIKQGEMQALVTATGNQTKFARTAKLVEGAGAPSHFQKAVLTIGDFLIYVSLGLAAILVLAQLIRGDSFLTVFQFVLILVVAAIPVAMPAVLSVTMALGALMLSKMKAIVSKLQSIEEIAGIDILCSDKTGTLTKNELTLGEPAVHGDEAPQDLILSAALASPLEDRDAMDQAVVQALEDREALKGFEQVEYTPFNPTAKRTQATVKDSRGQTFKVSKGAPQVIFKLCGLGSDEFSRARETVDEFAGKGYRTLGVARAEQGSDDWQFLGLLPFYDPPREDSAETIKQAREYGIQVKMVTGDNTAIGREISKQLGLSANIKSVEDIFPKGYQGQEKPDEATSRQIAATDGFAEVFPEHKYAIVKALQDRGHLVAMTGDGVNDAPALKQADVGIAVSGATSAAQSASSLVLTKPGLSVIIRAIEEARRIFERMNSYAIYRITETIRIMFFVVLAMIVFNFYPISTVMIILLALLNDLPIMTIAYDRTFLPPKPVRWEMKRVITVSTALGLIGVAETFLLLLIGKFWLGLPEGPLQSFVYLKLAVAGHMTLFIVRTKKPFWARPHPAPLLLIAIIGTQVVAALIVGFGFLVAPIPWLYVLYIWLYCIVWALIEDRAKLAIYEHIDLSGKRHQDFLKKIQKGLHAHIGT
ncbi:MAG: plasma-membrane proton-efflux P-type ATPase [Desulfohalobiaceae bacterium]|nr:plasma-membrane proton-efflux P-type ATPase [Desulfohalobiaceae bacterium]